MPTKKPRGQELTREQQRANQALHSRRLRIEHVNSSVKRCRIVKDRIRLWKEGVRDLVMELCCALHNVTVQVVTTGITPQLAPSVRLGEAEKELLHPVRRLHTQWSGTPRRYAAVASTWPRPSSCFRQSASPPRSACQSSPYARAHRDGSTALRRCLSMSRHVPAV